ncbi:hypothetical protein SUGI_0266810 [Cryptomeria japonica]|nr:hypothetical protein SUGI_0266810 [Cryptomeria japonica]
MEGIPRLKAGSSAEQVECSDELITGILSRVSTRDVLKMSTVHKRWRKLIFDPSFAHTHYKNSHPESMFCVIHRPTSRWLTETYQFHSYNSETGNLSIVTFSWEGLDIKFLNENFELLTTSNGLMCFYQHSLPVDMPELWVYNPVTMFLRKLSVPSEVGFIRVSKICYTQNTLKFVMVGRMLGDHSPYTLVFDFQSNSWYKGQPLLRSFDVCRYLGSPLFFNGVIYFAARVEELKEIRDVEALLRDDQDCLYMIIGYDVNQDQWSFSIFVPTSVGYPYCLIEWEGNLLLCASNSSYALAARSNHDRNRRIRDSLHKCDGHFVFWILDTEHKMWIREWEFDLSHELHTPWKVSASGGVVWFTCCDNSVTVYHMKNRHWSTHPLDDPDNSLAPRHPLDMYFVSFEPTLLSF